MWTKLLAAGLGGALGSMLRYLSSVAAQKFVVPNFPVGTFAVNVIGSMLIGLLIGLFDKEILTSSGLRIFLISGFCGGFTTFSAFSAESLQLIQLGNWGLAALYILFSVLLCIGGVAMGLYLVR